MYELECVATLVGSLFSIHVVVSNIVTWVDSLHVSLIKKDATIAIVMMIVVCLVVLKMTQASITIFINGSSFLIPYMNFFLWDTNRNRKANVKWGS